MKVIVARVPDPLAGAVGCEPRTIVAVPVALSKEPGTRTTGNIDPAVTD